MIDNLIWNFPKSGHSTLTSSDNNNIDTFADDRIGNLVREILQNSLDAHLNAKPVRVEFKSFKAKTSDFPGLETFKSYLEEWKASQTDVEDDDKDLLFVNRALKELAKDEMVWLRVSDFNTTGLWGASSNSNKTPYFSFVHGSGKNAKQSRDSGGSKGVGKNALFANSNLQTLFVSTLTKNGERTFIGVGFLVSSNETDIEKDWTQGVCFCVENNEHKERNRPLNAIVNLDPSFDREKEGIGTDVYIPSFMLEDGWIKEVTGQVIYSFLPALLNNQLIVSVVDGLTELGVDVKTDLDSSTISSLINQSSIYKNKNQQSSCVNIYHALTSTNRKEFVDKSKPGFKMSMYLFEDEYSGDNKLYIYRCPTRMLIKYEPISAFVKCSGVLFVEGEELTQRLRSIEDATHSKWSKSKAIKTKYKKEQIEEALGAVTIFIERNANNFGNNGESNESDFDYMVQNDWCSAEDDHEISKENNKDIGLPVPKAFFSIRNDPSKHSRKKPLKRKSNKITDDESEVTGLIEIEGLPGEKEESFSPDGHNSGTGGSIHEGSKEQTVDETNNGQLLLARKKVETADIRMSSVSPKDGLFNLLFTPKSSGTDAEIEISIIGTGSNDIIPVMVVKAKNGLFPLKTKRNRIFLKKIERGSKYKVAMKLDVNQNYVWEVNISANE